LALVGCGNKQEQEIQEPQTNTIKLTPQEIENPDFRNVKR
jgi:hypothetical protein